MGAGLTNFESGQHALFRTIKGRQIHGAFPVTVLDDGPDLNVLYLAEGTPLKWPVLASGEEPRSLPPEEMFSTQWTLVDRSWTGNGILMITEPGVAHSVWIFWDGAERRFWGWYVNLQAPFVRSPLGFDTEDHTLDIWVEPDRTWSWKDEHELEAAIKVGYYTPEEGAAIRAEGARVVERIERWNSPFCDGWESWEPDPTWPLPSLPAEWDRV